MKGMQAQVGKINALEPDMEKLGDAELRAKTDEFRARRPDVVERVRARFLETSPRGYIGCCDAIRDLDYTARLPSIAAPTLVIAGEKDAGTPPAMAEEIAKRIPDARLAIIPGAAHLSAVEKPAEFAALVRDFLAA